MNTTDMSDNDSERLVATPIGSEETEGEGATEQRAMLHAKGLVKRDIIEPW